MIKGKKLGLVGRCLLGTGLALSCASCEYMIGESVKQYGINTGDLERAQAGERLGNIIEKSGDWRHDLAVAERGKTQFNVNVGSGRIENPSRDQPPITIYDTHGQQIQGHYMREDKTHMYIWWNSIDGDFCSMGVPKDSIRYWKIDEENK